MISFFFILSGNGSLVTWELHGGAVLDTIYRRQGKMSKKLQVMILIVLFLSMTGTITACSITSWKVKSRLNNPTQIEVHGNYLYFLDTYSAIKIYDRGIIYDLTSWLPEGFKKENKIMDFAVVNPSKIVALTGSSLYMIDARKKEIKKIFSDKDNFTSMDLDQKGNFYLVSAKQVVKITPEGEKSLFFALENLPSGYHQEDAYFSGIFVGKNDHLFVEFHKNIPFSNIVFELDGGGNITNVYDLKKIIEKGFSTTSGARMLDYEDFSLFIVDDRGKLYKYRPGTGSLRKLFDVALGDFHYWHVIDLVKTSDDFDEYVLLVTDSDTGNFARVWKLLKDGTPVGNFISTEVTLQN